MEDGEWEMPRLAQPGPPQPKERDRGFQGVGHRSTQMGTDTENAIEQEKTERTEFFLG
jgi:hypothetical protein